MPHTLEELNTAPQVTAPEFPVVIPEEPERPGRTQWIWVAAVVILLAVATTAFQTFRKPATPPYVTARAERGTVARTITATGKVQAVTTVQVGTQVSGIVSDVFVDYNSPVKKGQIIAQLDQSQLQAQLLQERANLTSAQMAVQTNRASIAGAQAAVEAAQANVDRLQSMVDDAQLNFNRTQQLVDEKVTARNDLDTAKATLNQAIAQKQQGVAQLNQAKAQVNSGQSQLAQAQAQVTQAQAQVNIAAVNLDRAIIRAPIDGVIVARSVDPGQTVAASLNTPTLFLIANDLTRMQVLADIDEADVGQLTNDSRVNFTVDAFPNETFEGKIAQIRLASQIVQNVVTYTAVINVDNRDGKLRPGMTANVTATTSQRDNVLTIPNAALRFRPSDGRASAANGSGAANRKGTAAGTSVWRLNDDRLERVKVQLGITNGVVSEVTGGDLHEGDTVAVAAQNADQKRPAANGSPLGMTRGGGRVR